MYELASHPLLLKAENDFTQALRAHTATVEKSNSNIKAIELIQCTSSHRGRSIKTLSNHRDSNVCSDQSWLHIISEVAEKRLQKHMYCFGRWFVQASLVLYFTSAELHV